MPTQAAAGSLRGGRMRTAAGRQATRPRPVAHPGEAVGPALVRILWHAPSTTGHARGAAETAKGALGPVGNPVPRSA
eukprot:1958282-Alexandrium_andersonii.AAC.1